MCAGVSKSGSPISRCTISRPCASSARARASTSNADSVPSRPMRSATFIGFSFRNGGPRNGPPCPPGCSERLGGAVSLLVDYSAIGCPLIARHLASCGVCSAIASRSGARSLRGTSASRGVCSAIASRSGARSLRGTSHPVASARRSLRDRVPAHCAAPRIPWRCSAIASRSGARSLRGTSHPVASARRSLRDRVPAHCAAPRILWRLLGDRFAIGCPLIAWHPATLLGDRVPVHLGHLVVPGGTW